MGRVVQTPLQAWATVGLIEPSHPPPPFFVSAHYKGLSTFRKSFRMNTCENFLEVFILKGLRCQKNR